MAERMMLGEILLQSGLISPDKLERALEEQRTGTPRQRLGTIIVKMGFATEDQVAAAVAQQSGLAVFDPRNFVPTDAAGLVSRQFAERHLLIPVSRFHEGGESGLVVAMADPTNVVAIDDVRVTTGIRSIRVQVATQSGVIEAIRRSYGLETQTVTQTVSQLLKDRNLQEVDIHTEAIPTGGVEDDLERVRRETEMAPVVQLINSIIADAAKSRATDIHIEPQSADVRVRYRVDGVLREVSTLPLWLQAAMLSRLKIVSGMDIAERRRPQDGRARVTVDGRPIDVRVSTIATMHGEKAVVRLLPDSSAGGGVTIEKLGLAEDQLGPVERHVDMPQGLILFTGPTGSGKTTSMYAVLHRLASPERNVTTLEDPVEYQMRNVNQIQVDEKTGLTFAAALRTVLRQDPDVILVGEIRDAEAARICIQAAMTGHLVFSTLHTNDSASAVTRLTDIGIEPFLISSSLSMVVAQRLLRRVCSACAEPLEPSERTLELLGLTRESLIGKKLVSGRGCPVCAHTGYRGRLGVYEVLEITPSLRERIAAGASPAVLTVAARAQGMRILREAAFEKAFAGETTLEEVLRATHFDREETRHCVTCGREVEAEFVSCPYCMTSLNPKTCPSCARPIEPEWRGCPYCGAQLAGAGHEGGVAAVPSASRSRLLLVEDDRATALLVRTMLDREFDVTVAHTGGEALEKASATLPQVVLLDLGLPDLPGTEVLRRLRDTPEARDVSIVVLTAADDKKSEIECLEAGVDDFLHKPVVEDVLRARLAALLRRRAARATWRLGASAR